jgi:hypothetical protein
MEASKLANEAPFAPQLFLKKLCLNPGRGLFLNAGKNCLSTRWAFTL